MFEGDGMRDKYIYEYVIELNDTNGDIVNILYFNTFREVMENLPIDNYDIALVQKIGNDNEGVKDIAYAYLIDGNLSPTFDNGNKVPNKYLKEMV